MNLLKNLNLNKFKMNLATFNALYGAVSRTLTRQEKNGMAKNLEKENFYGTNFEFTEW